MNAKKLIGSQWALKKILNLILIFKWNFRWIFNLILLLYTFHSQKWTHHFIIFIAIFHGTEQLINRIRYLNWNLNIMCCCHMTLRLVFIWQEWILKIDTVHIWKLYGKSYGTLTIRHGHIFSIIIHWCGLMPTAIPEDTEHNAHDIPYILQSTSKMWYWKWGEFLKLHFVLFL